MGVKDKVLLAAENLFATKGYENTSIQEIIDEAEVSKGGLYHHFDSKAAVLDSLLMQFAKNMRKLFENALVVDPTQNEQENIYSVFRKYASTKDSLPKQKQDLYLKFLFTPDEIVIREKFLHYIREEMVIPLETSIERLTNHPSPKAAAYLLIGMTEIQTRLPLELLADKKFNLNFGLLFMDTIEKIFG